MSASNNGQVSSAAPTPYVHRRAVEPPVDVLENPDNLLVVADVPGASSETIELRIENDTLTLEAKRPAASQDNALAREYEEVDYARSFRIPAGIDTANITAEAKNGTVVVRLPKAAAAKTRKIEVRPS